MGTFIRRFKNDPGADVLLNIESINILDLTPASPVVGTGTGTALLVGEFEDGPFAKPTEIASASDLVSTFGGFGFTYDGVPGNNPCARARKADNALVPEYWNGNGYVAIYGKTFSRLILSRVDTSVGSVDFRRRASLLGAAQFSYDVEPGNTIVFDKGDGTPLTATFSATAGTVTSGAGTYSTGFVGGETLTLGYDDAPNVSVTFFAGDQTQAQVIARINAAFGFAFVDGPTGTTLRLTGRRRGSRGQVRVVSASAAGVLTTLGLVVATTLGTGNVGDVDAVSFPEFKTVVEAAVSGLRAELTPAGAIRVSIPYAAVGDYLRIVSATAASFGFVAGAMNSNDGKARYLSAAGTYPTGFVGGEVLQLSVDGGATFSVQFLAGDTTQAAVISRINAAAGYTLVSAYSATKLLFVGKANGGSVQVLGASAAGVLTALGLTVTKITAGGVIEGKIPAGTLIQDSTAQKFVTMQTLSVTAANPGAYSAPVRHALDDGTGTSVAPGGLNAMSRVIEIGAYDVVNPLTVTAALTETQIDARYSTAFDATKSTRNVARDANHSWSARQSNSVRRKGRDNALDASANGCLGRHFVARPPLNTLRDTAASRIAEPGVGATADERVYYAYPGFAVALPEIQARGLDGGAGFTADGLIDVGSDSFLVSTMSQLQPEENPAQQTDYLKAAVSLERGANVQNFEIGDYQILKRAGVCAATFDESGAGFQSGVTSVDPVAFPSLVNIARRNMADYIQDSLARLCRPSSKKTMTLARINQVNTTVSGFMATLLSKNDPSKQRIAGYTVDGGSTPKTLKERGLHLVNVAAQTLNSFDSIVLAVTAGESVSVTETIPA
jgi:hypothetical protein